MNRRNFISTSLLAACGISASTQIIAQSYKPTIEPELIVARGHHFADLFSLSLDALGGFNRFFPRGTSILLKPSMHVLPGYGSPLTSDPELVQRIIEHCYEAKSSKVLVLDRTYDAWKETYDQSGIERAAKKGYAKVIQANNLDFYKPSSKILHFDEEVSLHKTYLESDVIINVSTIYIDKKGQYFGPIRNMGGVLWQREMYDQNQELQIKLLKWKRPILNVVQIGTDNPQLIISSDIVAIEAYACDYFLNLNDKTNQLKQFEKENLGTTSYWELRQQHIF